MSNRKHISKRQFVTAALAGGAAAAPFSATGSGPAVTSLDTANYTAIAATSSSPMRRGSAPIPKESSISIQQGVDIQSARSANPSTITVEMTPQRRASQSSAPLKHPRRASTGALSTSSTSSGSLIARDTCPPAGRCGPGYSHSKLSYRCLSDKERHKENIAGIAAGSAIGGAVVLPTLAFFGYQCLKPRRHY